MIEEANRIQSLGKEVKKAEGADLEFIGYHRTSGTMRMNEHVNYQTRSSKKGRDQRVHQESNMSSKAYESSKIFDNKKRNIG
jgi:hypothetical protein